MIIFFQLIRYKCMHVITYSPNFAPPHFAARVIPNNTPHGTMEDHTAYIYMLSIPSGWRFFLFLYAPIRIHCRMLVATMSLADTYGAAVAHYTHMTPWFNTSTIHGLRLEKFGVICSNKIARQ